MTVLAVKPLILKNVDLLLGSGTPDDFAAHASAVTLSPTSSSVTWAGLKGNTYSDQSAATWTVGLEYVQDWESASSLSRYLYDHELEHIPVTFRPVAGGPSFTGVLIVTPGQIGGQVNAASTASVTLGLEGRPVLVAGSTVPVVTTALPSGAAAGAAVTIRGNNFTGATSVKFAAVSATVFTVVDAGVIVAVMPAGTAGSAPVTVVTPAGTSNALAYTRA